MKRSLLSRISHKTYVSLVWAIVFCSIVTTAFAFAFRELPDSGVNADFAKGLKIFSVVAIALVYGCMFNVIRRDILSDLKNTPNWIEFKNYRFEYVLWGTSECIVNIDGYITYNEAYNRFYKSVIRASRRGNNRPVTMKDIRINKMIHVKA